MRLAILGILLVNRLDIPMPGKLDQLTHILFLAIASYLHLQAIALLVNLIT